MASRGTLARLFVDLEMRDRQFRSDLDRDADAAEKAHGRLRRALGGIATTAGGFLVANAIQSGFSALEGGIMGAIGAASDLNETVSKTNAIFGSSAAEIVAWGDTAADKLGLSKNAALDAAGVFGGMAKSAGLAGGDVVDFSKDMVQAAADLGSFFNVDPTQVLDDIRSGLAGESEPLRKYNIFINDATVKTEAYRLGLAAEGDELTENQKIIARHSLILKGMGDAQGDAAKTADGFANGTRRLRAHIANLRAEIGMKFLPIVAAVVKSLNRWFAVFDDFRKRGFSPFMAGINALQKVLTDAFGAERATSITATILDARDKIVPFFESLRRELPKLAAEAIKLGSVFLHILLPPLGFIVGHIGTIAPLIGSLVVGFKAATLAMKAFAAAEKVAAVVTALLELELSPLLIAVVAIGAAVALFALAYSKNWFHVRDITNKVVGWIVKQFHRFMAIVRGGKGLHNAIADLPKPLQKLAIALRRVIVLFDDLIHGRWDKAARDLVMLGRTIGNLFQSIGLVRLGDGIKKQFANIAQLFRDVVALVDDVIHGRWSEVWDDFKAIAVDAVRIIIQQYKNYLNLFIDLFKLIPWGTIWDGLTAASEWVVTQGVPMLFGYGVQLISALWDGMVAIWRGTIRPWLHDRADAFKSSLSGAYNTLWLVGHYVFTGFWDGIERIWDYIVKQLAYIASVIANPLFAAYNAMWSVGHYIFTGLYDGLVWVWNNVIVPFLSMVTNAVSKYKGPPAKDKKLLEPSGRWIMGGLMAGIEAEVPKLWRLLGDITTSISGEATANLAVRPVAPAAAMGGGQAMNARTVNIAPGAIVVNGAGDPEATARAILRKIRFVEAGAA